MQKVGDVCTCCSGKDSGNSSPRRLKRIGSNLTQNKSLIVLGCEHCDSDVIFKIARSTNKE